MIDENMLKSKVYTICGVKVMLDADLATKQSLAIVRLFKSMKGYIAAENQQLLGCANCADVCCCNKLYVGGNFSFEISFGLDYVEKFLYLKKVIQRIVRSGRA